MEDWKPALENRKARVAYLSQFLTPEELLSYRISQDGGADAIGVLLRGMDSTDEEFRKVFAALDGENLNRGNGLLAPAVEAKLKQALGDERYAEYQKQVSPENSFFNEFVYSAGLTDEQIHELRDLRSRADSSQLDPGRYKDTVAAILQSRRLVYSYFDQPLVSSARPGAAGRNAPVFRDFEGFR